VALNDGFRLGDWEVLPLEGRLQRDGETRRLRPRAMDVLRRLAEANGDVVERDVLLSDVWGRTAVTDEPLTATVGELRRVLGDRRGAARYIETIPKRGYRLLEPVVPLEPSRPAKEPPAGGIEPAGSKPPRNRIAAFVLAFAAVLAVALVFVALRDRPAGEPAQPAKSLAVLPFTDLTPTGDRAWFADGMAEEVLNLMARVPSLRVAARTSSFSFRDSQVPVSEIANALDVTHVLEGSVRQSGDRLRVSVQLVNATDGFQLWTETYDRELDDLFAIQDAIAAEIVSSLQLRLLGEPPEVIVTQPEAYTLYLRANYLVRDLAEPNLREATELYLRSLDIDPGYAPSWAELSATYANRAAAGYMGYDDGYRKAREAAQQAIEADRSYARGYERLAWVALWYDGDMRAAARHLQTALALSPANPVVIGTAAVLEMALGRVDRAIRLHEYSAARSPLDPVELYNLGLSYKYAGRLEEAEATFRRVLELSSDYTACRYHLGETLLLAGRPREALETWETVADDAYRIKGHALAHFTLGNREAADEALAELTERFGAQWPSEIAHVHAWRGEPDAAFDWLEREYETYGAGGWGEWKLQPLYANLHDDPRWQAFLERVGATDEALAAIDFEVSLPD